MSDPHQARLVGLVRFARLVRLVRLDGDAPRHVMRGVRRGALRIGTVLAAIERGRLDLPRRSVRRAAIRGPIAGAWVPGATGAPS